MKIDKRILELETQIFNELKDSKDNLEYMCKKYEGTDINFNWLLKRIINYQYKTYGIRLKEKIERNKTHKNREMIKYGKRSKNKQSEDSRYNNKLYNH